MVIRVHGVIGGPRHKRIIRPRLKPGFFPDSPTPSVIIERSKPKKQEIEAFIVSSKEDDKTTHLPVETPLDIPEPTPEPEAVTEAPEAAPEVFVEKSTEEEFDPIEEEDKNPSLDSLFPPPINDKPICSICGFVSKSARGLKSHKKRKHFTVNV